MARAEEFSESYYQPSRKALSSWTIKKEKIGLDELMRRYHQKYTPEEWVYNFELDHAKQPLLMDSTRSKHSGHTGEKNDSAGQMYRKLILPRTRQAVDEVKRIRSKSTDTNTEYCGMCL
jgi:predicted aldo/keto reductase-like oxidoreductase